MWGLIELGILRYRKRLGPIVLFAILILYGIVGILSGGATS